MSTAEGMAAPPPTAPPLTPQDYAAAWAAQPAPSDRWTNAWARLVWQSILRFLKRDLGRVVIVSLIAFVIGWLVNVWVIGFIFDGVQKVPSFAPGTGSSNVVGGTIFYAIASALVTLTMPSSRACPSSGGR